MSNLPAIPEGDRFKDVTKFRRLGGGGGSFFYECWEEAIKSYGQQCIRLEREECAKMFDSSPNAEMFREDIAKKIRDRNGEPS